MYLAKDNSLFSYYKQQKREFHNISLLGFCRCKHKILAFKRNGLAFWPTLEAYQQHSNVFQKGRQQAYEGNSS